MLVAVAQSRAAYDVALLTYQQLDPTILKLATTIRTTPGLSSLRLVLLATTGKEEMHNEVAAWGSMPTSPCP